MGGYPPTGNKKGGCWEAFPLALVMLPYGMFMLWRDRRSGNKKCKGC